MVVSFVEAQTQQLVRQDQGLFAQFAITQAGVDGAAAGVEVRAGTALCSVVQSFGNGGEIGSAKRQVVARWSGFQIDL